MRHALAQTHSHVRILSVVHLPYKSFTCEIHLDPLYYKRKKTYLMFVCRFGPNKTKQTTHNELFGTKNKTHISKLNSEPQTDIDMYHNYTFARLSNVWRWYTIMLLFDSCVSFWYTKSECGEYPRILCGILTIPNNIVMDWNDVMYAYLMLW